MSAPLASLSTRLVDEAATADLAAQLAGCVRDSGGRIHLRGELGAGKTTLVRALLRALGVQGRIKSPTYTLLESYNVSNLYCYHFDFYRFSDAHEWQDAGFREMLDDTAVVLIEWPEQAGAELPAPDLDIRLEYAGTGRRATLDARSDKGRLWLTHLIPPKP